MYRLLLATLFAVCATAEAQPGIDWQADLADRNARAKAQSHCIADEVPVFTCKIGKKIASICASKVLDESQGYLQYRFGERNNVELEIPPKAHYKPAMVGYMSALCASCYANYVRFKIGDFRYYVFNASVRGPNDPKTGASTRDEPSGVVVMKSDKVIFSRRCTTPAFDHNVGEHFWGKAVVTLGAEDEADPFEIAFPTKP
jgi:hypothetical protein